MEMRHFEIGLFIIPFIFMSVLRFGSSADFGHEQSREEYTTVFKNIPIVFERLIQMLEEKPEVLESDDTSVFNKRQTQNKDEAVESNENLDATADNKLKKRATGDIVEESEEHTKFIGQNDDTDSEDKTYTEENDFYDDLNKNDQNLNNDIKNVKPNQPIQNKLFMLSSDEIAEQSIIIEQMLEKQNNEESLI